MITKDMLKAGIWRPEDVAAYRASQPVPPEVQKALDILAIPARRGPGEPVQRDLPGTEAKETKLVPDWWYTEDGQLSDRAKDILAEETRWDGMGPRRPW
jgi:hypothetical protein